MPEHQCNSNDPWKADEGLVKQVVNKTWWRGCGIDREDAEQIALIAHLHAHRTFDSARSKASQAHTGQDSKLRAEQRLAKAKRGRAFFLMRAAVLRTIYESRGLPEERQRKIASLSTHTELLALKLGRMPSITELANDVNMTEEQVIELTLQAQRVRSLDDPLQEDSESTVGDMVCDPLNLQSDIVARVTLKQILAMLTAEEREIVYLDLDGYSGEEIGLHLGNMPSGTVRAKLSRARAKMRSAFQAQSRHEGGYSCNL